MKPSSSMLRTALLAVAACASAPAAPASRAADPPPGGARLPDDAIIETMLARVGRAAGCPASHRVWCIAADGWARGSAADLPAGDRVLFGLSIGLERDRPDDELLATEVSLCAFALRGTTGGRAGFITDIPPENETERRIIRAAVSSLGKVLRGEKERPELTASLVSYAQGLIARASYMLSRTAAGWVMTGKSLARIRKVGKVWVAVEVPRSGPEGIFLSLYPE